MEVAIIKMLNQVTPAMEKNIKLKPFLNILHGTMNSLRNEIIRYHHIQNETKPIDERIIFEELHQGEKLMAKLFQLRSWNYFWLDEYTERLLGLDVSLFNLFLALQNVNRANDNKKAGKLTLKEEEQGSDEEEAAARVVFQRLFEAVMEGRKNNPPKMIKSYLNRIYWIMKVDYDKPIKEVKSIREEMEKGVEVVRRSSGLSGFMRRKHSKSKYECARELQRLLHYISPCILVGNVAL